MIGRSQRSLFLSFRVGRAGNFQRDGAGLGLGQHTTKGRGAWGGGSSAREAAYRMGYAGAAGKRR